MDFLLGVTAEMLRAKKDRKPAISLQRDQFDSKFQVKGLPPPFIFARLGLVEPIKCLTTLSLTVFTQSNFVADFLQAKCDFIPKSAVLRYVPPLGDLGATYDDHLRLIGKHVWDC